MTGGLLAPDVAVLVVLSALGLAVGSFLNVVVYRVPAGLSVVHPPSACPGCAHPVRSRDNVPVLSWVLLRGRCRDCSMSISARYPLVEAATGLAFALVWWRVQDPVVLAAGLVVAAAAIAMSLIDLDHGRLPFALTAVVGGVLVLVAALGLLTGHSPVGLGVLLLGPAVWTAVYGGIWLATAGRGMGLGDVALAPVLGLGTAMAGLGACLAGLAAGFVLGGVVGGALLLGGRITRGSRVPYGPFLLGGALLGLLAGPALAHGYLRLVGLA